MKGQKAKGMSLMSLVELLVVIGIVLALIVLILSAVRIGREIAMKTQCANNLRQLYLAAKLYEQTFGEPPLNTWKHFLDWQPSYRALLICPKDPFKGLAAGGLSYCHPPIPHSYMPSYWIAYKLLKGKIKILASPEMIKETIAMAREELINGNYFICWYHEMAISIDGKVRRWTPRRRD